MDTMRFPELLTPPRRPLDLASMEVFMVPRAVRPSFAATRAREAITRGLWRPADIEQAVISEPVHLWLPLWRVQGSARGFSFGVRPHLHQKGGGLRPTGDYKNFDGAICMPARRGFPIDVSDRVQVRALDLTHWDVDEVPAEEVVLPDIPGDLATEEARARLSKRGSPSAQYALYADIKVEIHHVRLVFYPMTVVRYRYDGEAVDGVPQTFFLALSGATGEELAGAHPSGWRSLWGKVRGFFEAP